MLPYVYLKNLIKIKSKYKKGGNFLITESLSTLKIHKLSQAQYDRELAAGRIDESALYLTPDNAVNLLSMVTLWENGSPSAAFAAQNINISGICNSSTYPYIIVVHDKGSEIIENKAGNYMLSFNSIGVNNGVNILWYSRQVTLANGVVSFANCNYASLGYSDNVTTIQGSAANANIIPSAIIGLKQN